MPVETVHNLQCVTADVNYPAPIRHNVYPFGHVRAVASGCA